MTPRQAKDSFLTIYNKAWNLNVHGVGGMDKEQVEVLFKTLKPVLDPDYCILLTIKGNLSVSLS